MNREAQATKQAQMPTIAKTWALRRAKLCVVLLRRLSGEPWLVASFGFCDIPLVWNIGRLVVKPLFSLFQLLHYPLADCGRHRYCETPRATTATTTSWWMWLGFRGVLTEGPHQLFRCGLTALPRSGLTECYRRRVPLPLPGSATAAGFL